MKHIGILAHSAEGSALCYITACHEGSRRMGEHKHPEITLSVLPMGDTMDAWEAGDLGFIRNFLSGTAGRLAHRSAVRAPRRTAASRRCT